MKRKVFISFKFKKDHTTALILYNLGIYAEDSILYCRDTKSRTKTDKKIHTWIEKEMKNVSCLVVIVSKTTYTNKWVLSEIAEAYTHKKGILAIDIYNLHSKCKAKDPFSRLYTADNIPLSAYITYFTPQTSDPFLMFENKKSELNYLTELAIYNRKFY